MKIIPTIIHIIFVPFVVTLISGYAYLPTLTSGQPEEQTVPLLVGRTALIYKGVVLDVKYKTDAETERPYIYVTFGQIEPVKDLRGEFAGALSVSHRLWR